MAQTSLDLWRLSARVSVENAAILIAGGNPSATADYFMHERVTPGFTAVLAALKDAIRSGDLRAQLFYAAFKIYPQGDSKKVWYAVIADSELRGQLPNAEVLFEDGRDGVIIEGEPDWGSTMLAVGDIKQWLMSRGRTHGFFFSEPDPILHVEDEFSSRGIDLFPPELALAVAAWRGVAGVNRAVRGAKAAIEVWIEAHPEAWRGPEPLTLGGKQRVAMVANWNRKGGAPRSGT